MEEKKYELLKEDSIKINDHTLFRIKALKDFNDVKAGDMGGYIEKENNLSQYDNCWVYNDARVYGNAEVSDDAKVFRNAKVFDDAKVLRNAKVSGNAKVYGSARVYGTAKVYNNTKVFGIARVYDNARVFDNARVYGSARVYGDAEVFNNAIVFGNARVSGNSTVSNNAYIMSTNDYVVIGPIGSRSDYTTFYLDKNKNIYVVCGCFNGTIDEFESAVKETHKNNNLYREQYLHAISYANYVLELNKEENDNE